MRFKSSNTPVDNNVKVSKYVYIGYVFWNWARKIWNEKHSLSPINRIINALAVATRPDITHTINFLRQFNSTSGKSHWLATKRILKYFKSTKSQGMCFYHDPSPLTIFVDANWVSDINHK